MEKSDEKRVEELREAMLQNAVNGVASTSVDGVSVTRQSNADLKIALDEAKKTTVKQFPFCMMKWR